MGNAIYSVKYTSINAITCTYVLKSFYANNEIYSVKIQFQKSDLSSKVSPRRKKLHVTMQVANGHECSSIQMRFIPLSSSVAEKWGLEIYGVSVLK